MMILLDTIELDDAVIEFYENGSVQVIREGHRTSLSGTEAQTIADYFNNDV